MTSISFPKLIAICSLTICLSSTFGNALDCMSPALLTNAEESRNRPNQEIVMGEASKKDWTFRGVILNQDGSETPIGFFIPLSQRIPESHEVWGTGPSLPLDSLFIGPVFRSPQNEYYFSLGLCGPDLVTTPSPSIIAQVKQCLANGNCENPL